MNTQEIADLCWGPNTYRREKWYKLYEDPIFVPRYNYPKLEDQRDHAQAKILRIRDERLVSVLDFENEPHNIFTAHEMVGQLDGSCSIKFTVQTNLFGGTIQGLHTPRHRWIFKEIDDYKIVGSFSLTELGFGANTVQLETTAIYDDKTKEFIINTPTIRSQKFWISNASQHANHNLVFAQTIVNGKNEGVGAFIVPIRDMKNH